MTNAEEKKFSHLKHEANIRIGGYGNMSSDDEESKQDELARVKAANSKSNGVKNGRPSKANEKFRQTKLNWKKPSSSKI